MLNAGKKYDSSLKYYMLSGDRSQNDFVQYRRTNPEVQNIS